jgi:hypothetical protein
MSKLAVAAAVLVAGCYWVALVAAGNVGFRLGLEQRPQIALGLAQTVSYRADPKLPQLHSLAPSAVNSGAVGNGQPAAAEAPAAAAAPVPAVADPQPASGPVAITAQPAQFAAPHADENGGNKQTGQHGDGQRG